MATLLASSSTAASPSSTSGSFSSSSQARCFLLLLLPKARTPRPSPARLSIHIHSTRAATLHSSSSSSPSSSTYNGWADLAADPDLPLFALPQPSASLLLLLLPPLSLCLSRIPPLPLLAAAFAAGFAARHLAPLPSSHRLLVALADLDAHLRALEDRLPSSAADDDDQGPLLDAADRVRDAAARLAAQDGGGSATVLGDAFKEAAHYFGGLAREAMRDLTFSSHRKKIKEVKPPPPAAAAAVDAESKSDVVGVVDSAASSSAQDQQDDANELLRASAKHGSIARDKPLDSPVVDRGSAARALDMLPFDMDDHGLDDAHRFSNRSKRDGRVDRPVFKRRYDDRRDRLRNDPFEESMELESTLEIRDRSYRLKIGHRGESRANEVRERPSDHFVGNAASSDHMDDESGAEDSDGKEFSRHVMEAAEILKKVRECMMTRDDEETADALLYKSARLLSTAVALRPSSLAAVGQLGNTYLLHGELKLKVSRELRTLLSNSGALLNGRDRVSRSRKLDRRILSRDNISSALVDVCEECESLLVESGRSYRMALSIDSGDVKALYNWGLALIFRAQLLADIGPEAAVDADRVYLAAIDKFDAMLSKSNTYAPEALYRWGTALQQRSYLRSGKNKEKVRLLEQAKSMFEDVLYVEAENKVVREALSSCIAELNYHGRWLQ